MSAAIDILDPNKPKRIAIVASNPSVSKQTGWPIGFWWSELAHPYWEFSEHGYTVDIYSPDGGKLEADNWSDPRDESKYSEHDLISLGFICSSQHAKLIEDSKPISQLKLSDHDAILFVGGQAPMYTFHSDERVHALAAQFYKAGKLPPCCVMRPACFSKRRWMASCSSTAKHGPASPIQRKTTPTTSSASAFSRSGSRTKPKNCLEPTSSSRDGSKPMPCAMAI